MDRTLSLVREALVDSRVAIAAQFSTIVPQLKKPLLARFLTVYCLQGAALSRWLSEWNQTLAGIAEQDGHKALATGLMDASARFLARSAAFEVDSQSVRDWLISHVECDLEHRDDTAAITRAMKQLRHVFQECVKRKRFVTWLLVLDEIERLRIVHGFTLIKLCEHFFGSELLVCLSHIKIQRHENNALFALCETLLSAHGAKINDDTVTVIKDVKAGISAYAHYIENCFQLATQGTECLVNT